MMRRVVAAVDDLIFAARIRGTAEQLGVRIDFVKSVEAAIESAGAERRVDLVIADLHAQRIDSFALAERLKADESLCGVPLVGFFSHVHIELMHRARASGYDHVLPRSAFTKRLVDILRGDLDGSE